MSELERSAIARLVKQAEDMGLGASVPEMMRTFIAGDHGTNGGAIAWTRAYPDDQEVRVCCIGNDVLGPEYCLCWEPEFDLEQQPPTRLVASVDDVATQPRMCGDCAYRPGSPERSLSFMEEELFDLASTGRDVFFCHQGIRRPVRWRHPDGRVVDGSPADYQPLIVKGMLYQADGTPAMVCAGYSARVRQASEVVYPDWLMQLVDLQQDGHILPGGMTWEEPRPRLRQGGRVKGLPRSMQTGPGLQPAGGSPVPSVMVRTRIYKQLRQHPGRWARTFDGSWSAANLVAGWFRRHSAGGVMQTAIRRDGLTVAAYARYLAEDVT